MDMPVYTAGTFDLFHVGHVRFLRACAALGPVTVALNTDGFIEHYKGRPPVIPYDARREVLEACAYVRHVIPQDSECLDQQILRIRPRYLVIGSDWAHKDYYAQIGISQWWLDEQGIILVYVPYTAGVSTTQIRLQVT